MIEEKETLCCSLASPCPREYKPPIKFKDFEVKPESILMEKSIGKGSFGEVWRGIVRF